MRMRSATLMMLVMCISGCGTESDDRVGAAVAGTSPALVRRPAVQTQPIRTPCEWVTRAEAERILGTFAKPPQVVSSVKSLQPDDEGRACLYSMASAAGSNEIALEVDLAGGAEIQLADDMINRMLGGADASQVRAAGESPGWDEATSVGDVHLWRSGHVAILIADPTLAQPTTKLAQFAEAIRTNMQDLPFAAADDDPNVPGTPPDPCVLLTRAEVERVLGALLVEPYRSAQGSAIAESDGPSCSYYAKGHRAVVVAPLWSAGQAEFDTAVSVSRLTRAVAGGSNDADLLDGPWDEAASGADGTFLVLKKDTLLTIDFANANASLAQVAKLAETAVNRL